MSSPDFLSGGGELGALMRAKEWTQTPLGPPEQWPQSLRTSVSTCLNCSFPILLWWGPDLVKLYNDAYAMILGAKHPAALGRPGREVWPEIWDTIGPMLQSALRGEAAPADDLLLLLRRYGYAEECYFSFSYSPIHDESGGVGGVFCPVIETTAKIIGARRLQTLHELGTRPIGAQSAEDACASVADALRGNPYDVPFAALYLLNEAADSARRCIIVGINADAASLPDTCSITGSDGTVWPLAEAAAAREPREVRDLPGRIGRLLAQPWPEPVETALVLPITGEAERLAGLMIAGVSPRRALDAEYRNFFGLVAQHISKAIADARAYELERKRAEALAEIDRAKTAFFSNVSHEFRTPLTLMLAPLEDALNDRGGTELPAIQRERLDVAHRNSLRLLKLVNTLLDFSRI